MHALLLSACTALLRLFVCAACAALLLPLPASAQVPDTIQLSPPTGRTGGELVVEASGLAANASHRVGLVQPGASRPFIQLGEASTDANGQLVLAGQIPLNQPPGTYDLRLEQGSVLVRLRPFTVQGPLSLELIPIRPRAGQRITLRVGALDEGELSIDYGGQRLWGPERVSAGQRDIDLRLPTQWPSPLPATVPFIATLRRGGVRLAQGGLSSFIDSPRNEPPLRLRSAEVPAQPSLAFSPFVIRAELETDDGDLDEYSFRAFFRSDAGPTVPLGRGAVRANAQGRIELESLPASVFTQQQPAPSGPGDFYLIGSRTEQQRTVGTVGQLLIPLGRGQLAPPLYQEVEGLSLRVVDAVANPIEGAFVRVNALDRYTHLSGSGRDTAVSGEMLLRPRPNQLIAAAASVVGTAPEEFASCAPSIYRSVTNAQGDADFQLRFSDVQGFMLFNHVSVCPAVAGGSANCPGGSNRPVARLSVQVSARHLGYSARPDRCEDAVVELDYGLNAEDETVQLLNPDGTPLTRNIPVRLYSIPGGCGSGFGALRIQGMTPEQTNGPLGELSRIFQAVATAGPDQTKVPDANIFGRRQPEVRLPYDPFVTGVALTQATLRFDSTGDGNLDYVQPMVGFAGEFCGGEPQELRAQLPDLTRFAPGDYWGIVEVLNDRGNLISRPFRVSFYPLPDWFDLRQANRFRPFTMRTNLDSVQAVRIANGANLTSGSLPQGIGVLRNDSDNDALTIQRLDAGGYGGVTQRAISRNEVASQPGSPREAISNLSQGTPPQAFGSTVQTVLVDTGRIPLFRAVWGIPPIADATLGADFWLRSLLSFYGTVALRQDGTPLLSTVVTPQLDLGLDLWFDLRAVFGIVSARAVASAASLLQITATTVDNQLVDTAECFGFALGAKIEICGFGLCPFDESICLVDTFVPSSCNICSGPLPNGLMDPRCLVLPFSCAWNRSAGDAAAKSMPTRLPSPAPSRPSAVASNRGGEISSLLGGEQGVTVSRVALGQVVASALLDPGRRAESIGVAYHRPGGAVAVWSGSDIGPVGSSLEALRPVAQRSHLRFAVKSNGVWSAPRNLTLPGSADGNVVLAACWRGDAIGCGTQGRVLAVWMRDRAGDFTQRRYSLMYSIYNPATDVWSDPAPVDPTPIGGPFQPTDMQPTAVYVQGLPFIAWARSDGPEPTQLAERRLAYRAGLNNPVRIASGLPAGINWPSAAVDSQQRVVLAYTVTTDPTVFTGNRSAVHVARGNCLAGTCSFVGRALLDSHQRMVYGEATQVAVDENDHLIVQFRGLGFGTSPQGVGYLPTDPIGMLSGLGAIVQMRTTIVGPLSSTTSLDDNRQLHWQPAFAYDPTLRGTVSVSQAGQRLGSAQEQQLRKTHPDAFRNDFKVASLAEDTGLYVVPHGPELALEAALMDWPGPLSFQPVPVGLVVTNHGSALPGSSPAPTRVVATWEGPRGVAPQATHVVLPALGPGESFSAELSVPLPPGYSQDRGYRLYLDIDGAGAEVDVDATNNRVVLEVGGMPVPRELAALSRVGGGAVDLQWEPDTDARIAGWRVYAEEADGSLRALGSTPVSGFADISLAPGESRVYRVSSYSPRGFESGLSAPAAGALPMADGVFADGFEGVP